MTSSQSRTLFATAAVVAAGVAAWAVGNSTSNDTASSATPARFAPAAQAAPQGAPAGQAPPARGRGFGTAVSGATAAKVEKVVLAKYPGTLEVVVGLPDGSFVAHDITSSGELHVLVSKDFKIVGVDQGGGPPPGVTPQRTAPPSDDAPERGTLS